ncbi:hypothetical protein RHS01_03870 [Rhizoctonia solani]|uniref:Uncharacterized protein n=1 Tax=Rhizoctonia solani TaxID=456999 RepID=A0A8H7IHC5_9AGAM|nr:hypothetical protein RHS01_03870 [Rhizoctonia solani]
MAPITVRKAKKSSSKFKSSKNTEVNQTPIPSTCPGLDSSGESGRPTKSTRIALAADFGRDLGREVTEEEVDSLLWAKYKGTVEERQEAKQKGPSICASSGSSSKSSSPAPSLITSEYSSGDGANSESSVESVSSVDPFSTKSSYSQWLATITPAMAALLMVVDEKLAELELSKGANSF